MIRPLLPALLLALLLGGCASARGSLASMRGLPVLVVDAGGEGAAGREAALERALAVVPLRTWPGAAEEQLDGVLAGDGAGRVERAREAAEVRRLPWLLVRDAASARLETARGGDVIWEVTLKPRGPVDEQVRDGLTRVLVPAGEELTLDPSVTRLAGVDALTALRRALVEGRYDEHRAALDAALTRWPADPALRTHEGLLLVMGRTSSPAELERARAMAPESESELLAIALLAAQAENKALALTAREQLVTLYPGRIDYLPEAADLLAETEGAQHAVRLLLSTLNGLDREARLAVPPGSAPHEAPGALPYADLAFTAGWYQAEVGRWELAALAYEDAVRIYERLDRPRELGDTLNNAGVAMVEAERPLLAASTFRRALRVRRKGPDPQKAANTRYNLARALADAGKGGEALRTYLGAARDYASAGAPWESLDARVEALQHLAAEGERASLEELAAEILAESGERRPSDSARAGEVTGNTWFELGRARLVLQDAAGSLAAYGRSLEVWVDLDRRVEQGQTLYSMALPHLALFEFSSAFDDLVAALEIAVETGDSSSILAIRVQLGEVRELVRKSGQELPEVPEHLRGWLH